MTMRVTNLWRFPVKSHGAEALETVTLTAGQAMPWDRTWAVAHEAAKAQDGVWSPCANFSRAAKAPGLMALTSVLDEATEMLTLRHPDLGEVTLHPTRDAQALIDWTAPLIPDARAQSSRVVHVGPRGMTDSPFPSLSVLSLASLRDLGAKMGMDLSPLRFRGNIWFDGAAPWAEFDWLGTTVQIGSAEIEIKERITRCLATTANPETGARDADTLGTLETHWNHQDFGIYALVTKTGTLSVGDTLELRP